MAHSKGVLPDPVIRDHRAEALLVFADLRADLDGAGVQAWLQRVSELITQLTRAVRGRRLASVAVGLGPSFFLSNGSPRFELGAEVIPAGLRNPSQVTGVHDADAGAHDVLFYVMTLSEAVVANFFEGLSSTCPDLAHAVIERGFQRTDGRELFGFKDGIRNVHPRAERARAVFVDRDRAPDEPSWCEDGTYMAYMKLRQDLDRWRTIAPEDQERIMGRRRDDGSRLDRPAGSDPRQEGPITGDSPAPNSHVPKSGPRGDLHDRTQIFRRGVPWITLREADGGLEGGLQFVSFQWSLDNFHVVLERWMQNPHFPQPNSGVDRLFADGLVSIQKAGFYFTPPNDSRYIAAGLFDPPATPSRPRSTGRVIIRKRAVNTSGGAVPAEVGNVGFQVFRASDQQPIGEIFFTDSAGHAMSGDLPVRTPLVVREVQVPPHLQAGPEQQITIERRRELLRFDDVVSQASPGYGG